MKSFFFLLKLFLDTCKNGTNQGLRQRRWDGMHGNSLSDKSLHVVQTEPHMKFIITCPLLNLCCSKCALLGKCMTASRKISLYYKSFAHFIFKYSTFTWLLSQYFLYRASNTTELYYILCYESFYSLLKKVIVICY